MNFADNMGYRGHAYNPKLWRRRNTPRRWWLRRLRHGLGSDRARLIMGVVRDVKRRLKEA